MNNRLRIRVLGTVQGVGMRPAVYAIARRLGLSGFVANTSEGVLIEVEGARVPEFADALSLDAPPLASIESIVIADVAAQGDTGFVIHESAHGGAVTLVPPDITTCPECLAEFRDPGDRRYRYPFINCTNCGPRYSITTRIPYDRPNTTMNTFVMCQECEAEYRSPGDRRFHAEPNACPVCGPRVTLYPNGIEADPAIRETVSMLLKGRIIAIKGIGGFHLACNAMDRDAVCMLRARKRKNNKPLALMAPDMETIHRHCQVSAEEERLLSSPMRPIVLLRRRSDMHNNLPYELAPGNPYIGFMLPYAPLHHLLFDGIEALVMTSGNLSEEPIVIGNDEAMNRLAGMADAFLLHDREIFMRVDDSVARVTRSGETLFIRRSRGFVPSAIMLDTDGPDVMSAGAELKGTFTLLAGHRAIVSQHIGDMENTETMAFYEETLANLKTAYGVNPVALAHDIHPGYLSTRWALRQSLPHIAVQHHHAHVGSAMAEHGLRGKMLGIVMDGTGYGPDGTLWGGEFLVADECEFVRAGHLATVPLPGGDTAVREPWRMAISYILKSTGGDVGRTLDISAQLGFVERFGEGLVRNVIKVCSIPQAAPPSSGMGRLFDAVSAICGICDLNTFEGEAPVAIENSAMTAWSIAKESYPYLIIDGPSAVLDFSLSILRIIDDRQGGLEGPVIAAQFHRTVIAALTEMARRLCAGYGLHRVALCGGSFQNMLLHEGVRDGLQAQGLEVYISRKVPLNDGGLSLGQAFISREVLRRSAS